MKFIISGSSGSGKNTVINRLLAEDENLAFLTTVTTRGMRPGESPGRPYRNVTHEEFRAMIARGEFLEYCEVHDGNLYGTNRCILAELERLGKTLIKDIDVDGTEALRKIFSDLVTIYLSVPREELKKRLIERGETEIEKRLSRYDYEESKKHQYDFVIQNDDLDTTVKRIQEIIRDAIKEEK